MRRRGDPDSVSRFRKTEKSDLNFQNCEPSKRESCHKQYSRNEAQREGPGQGKKHQAERCFSPTTRHVGGIKLMRISICPDTQRTRRRCNERVATRKQRSQPSVTWRRVDNGKGGPVVGTPKRHGGLMTGRSAKGRKETKERKKEKRTKGRRIPWGIVRDPPGGRRKE